MADSLAKQVTKYLEENPKATNQDLYEKYPDVRKNTLRHYKSKFASTGSAPKKENSKKVAKVKVTKTKNAKAKTTKAENSPAKNGVDKTAQKIVAYLAKNPKATSDQIFAEFPTETKISLRTLKQEYKNKETPKDKDNKRKKIAVKVKTEGKVAARTNLATAIKTKIAAKSKAVKAVVKKGAAASKKKTLLKQKVGKMAKIAIAVRKKVPSSDALSRISALEKKVRQLTTALADATKKVQQPIMKKLAGKKLNIEKLKDLEETLLNVVSEKISGFISGLGSKHND